MTGVGRPRFGQRLPRRRQRLLGLLSLSLQERQGSLTLAQFALGAPRLLDRLPHLGQLRCAGGRIG